ncbi:Aspartic peptidase [Theobroma cacao]|nr:Aspartic peptidase [Theobroma cacao]
MPSYVKFLKDILTKKRKLEDFEIVALTEECCALIQNKLPPKLKDLGSFSIPYIVGGFKFTKALCDLGAGVSIMPLSIAKKLGRNEMQPTTVSLQLAYRTIKYPIGIIKDVLVKVGHLYIPVDFIVLEMEEDLEIPLIFGRPFLATAGIIIDVREDKITFKVGEKVVEFNIFNANKHPSSTNCCYGVELIDEGKGELTSEQESIFESKPPPPLVRSK